MWDPICVFQSCIVGGKKNEWVILRWYGSIRNPQNNFRVCLDEIIEKF